MRGWVQTEGLIIRCNLRSALTVGSCSIDCARLHLSPPLKTYTLWLHGAPSGCSGELNGTVTRTSILWLHFPWRGFSLVYRQKYRRAAVACAFLFWPNSFILLHLGMSCPDRHRFDRKMHNRCLPGGALLLQSKIAAVDPRPHATLSTGKTLKENGWMDEIYSGAGLARRRLFK